MSHQPAGLPADDETLGRPVIATAWAFEEGVPSPQPYLNAGIELSEAISEDPAWQRWWAGTGLTNVRLYPYYTRTGGGEHPDQRRSRGGEAVVHCTFDVARFDALDEAGLAELAAQDFLTMMSLVPAERSLPPLPPVPAAVRVDPIPDDREIGAALNVVMGLLKQQGVSDDEIEEMQAQVRRFS